MAIQDITYWVFFAISSLIILASLVGAIVFGMCGIDASDIYEIKDK